ncbi:MAG: hypothetical protein WDN06_20350 [Asticcacaulis sp.]
MLRHLLAGIAAAVFATAAISSQAWAAPIVTLDRNGAWVSVEAYGPNVVHVTIAADKAEVLKPAGYGILTDHVDNSAFKTSGGQDGDSFTSSALTLHVKRRPAAARPPARAKSISPRRWLRSAFRSRTPAANNWSA